MKTVDFQLLTAGYCRARENQAIRGGVRRWVDFPATFGLLEHPDQGLMLFDTGYTRRFFSETARFPASLYARLFPGSITETDEAVAQLARRGIAPGAVRYVLLSHLHADHIGGLRDFPAAQFVVPGAAWEAVRGKRGFAALRQGFLPGLLPADFTDRLTLLDTAFPGRQKDPFWGETYDLFGDGSIRFVPLPGHATGQMGALLRTHEGEVLLAADACWLSAAYREARLPPWYVRLVTPSWGDLRRSLHKVAAYHRQHPATRIIPCHCPDEATQPRRAANQVLLPPPNPVEPSDG